MGGVEDAGAAVTGETTRFPGPVDVGETVGWVNIDEDHLGEGGVGRRVSPRGRRCHPSAVDDENLEGLRLLGVTNR